MAMKFQSMRSRRNEGSSSDAKGAEQTTSASPPGQTTEDPNGGHEATASGEVTFRHPFDAGNGVVSSPATETAPKQRKDSWWNRRRSSVQRILSVAFKKDNDRLTPGSGFLVFRSGADGGNFRTSIGQLYSKDEEVTRTASARVNAEEQIRASFSNPPVDVEPGTSHSRSTSNASKASSESPCDSSLGTCPSTAGRSRVEKWSASSVSGSEGPAERSRPRVPRKRGREEETSEIIDPETATVDSATAVKSGKIGYEPKNAASGFSRTTTPQAGNPAESAEENVDILSTPSISGLSKNWASSVNNAMVQAVEVASSDTPKQQSKRRQYDSYNSYDSYDSYEDYDYEINTPEPDMASMGTTRFMTPQNRPCASPAPPSPPKHHRRESGVYQESPLPMPTHGEYSMCNDYRAFENHRLAIAAEKVRNRYWDPLTGDWEQPGDDVYLEAAAWSAQSSPGDWRRDNNHAQRQLPMLGSYAYENGYPSPANSAYPSASAGIAFGDYYVRRRTSSSVDPLTNRESSVIEEDGDIWLEEPMAFEDDVVGGSGEWESQQPYWGGESAGNRAWDLSEVEAWSLDSQKAAADANAAGQCSVKGKRVDSLDVVQDEANDEGDVAQVMGQSVPGAFCCD